MEYRAYLNHKRRECPKRIVRCRFNCKANEEMTAEMRDYHEARFICPARPVECKWGCDCTVQAQQLTKHEKDSVRSD